MKECHWKTNYKKRELNILCIGMMNRVTSQEQLAIE